jgi:hypothetical protein
MTSSIPDKLERLRELLVISPKEPPTPSDRGLLVIYPPDQEAEFRTRLEDFLVTLTAQGVPHAVVDAEPFPFACLDAEGVLEDAFQLEAEEPKELRQYLASELPRRLLNEVTQAASTLPVGSSVILKTPTALFPWVKFADFLAQLPTGFPCRIVVPFPGHERGATLHFLDHRDGFNYLARRIN